MRVRIGVVGLRFGHAWARVYADHPGAELAALEDCRRLVETVEQTGRKYMMAETSNYYPEVVHVKRLVEEGKFGRLFYSESDYLHELQSLWRDRDGRPTWRMGLPPMLYPTHN